MDSKEADKIIKEFNTSVFDLIKICRKLEPSNIDLEWIHKQLLLAREMDPLLLINGCKDKLWLYREQIINEDSDFFLKQNFSTDKAGDSKDFMQSMIKLVKNKFQELSNSEKKVIWNLTKKMLTCVIKYKKIIDDF
jgi:hypothetical protein